MVFNNLIPRSGLPNRHESSAMRSMRDGDSVPNQWKKNQATSDRTSQIARSLSVVQRQVNVIRRRIVGGGVTSGAFRWAAAGRIYSVENSYIGDATGGELVEVAVDDDAVTIGWPDPDTGVIVKSTPGLYVALQNVSPIPDPANPGEFLYHIPLKDLPVSVNEPQTDFDPKNYWLMVNGASTGGGNINMRGLYVPGTAYALYDAVILGTGTSTGIYWSTINNNLNAPDSGLSWVQISSVQGQWF